MFGHTVQPSVVSLFSSTGSAPLQLFSQHVDPSPALREDSLIHLLNDTTSEPAPPEPGVLVRLDSLVYGERDRDEGDGDGADDDDDDEDEDEDGDEDGEERRREDPRTRTLCQTVLHIQSPTLRTTYIRCPPSPSPSPSSASASAVAAAAELGLTSLPWIHFQVRGLGPGREWAFEVGVADRAGRKGVIRCSTFQKEATLCIHRDPPLLHVPLRFPAGTSAQLFTSWSIISLDTGSMMQQFRVVGAGAQRTGHEEDTDTDPDTAPIPDSRTVRGNIVLATPRPLPSGALGSVTYVKVYANCRLRRIWMSENRRGTLPWEFELYASSSK